MAMINARDPQQSREAKHLYIHTSKTLTEFPVCMQIRQNVQHQQNHKTKDMVVMSASVRQWRYASTGQRDDVI